MQFKLLFVLLIAFSLNLFAGTPHGFDDQLRELISEHFEDDRGEISPNKVQAYRENVIQRKDELTQTIINFESKFKNEDQDEVAEELDKSDTLFIYDLILDYLNRLEGQMSNFDKKELAREILVLDFATKVTGDEGFGKHAIDIIKHFPGSNTLYKHKKLLGEASNLYNEKTGEFYSQEELTELEASGFDLSLIDPNSKGRFWYKRDIPNTNVYDIINGKTTLLYSGLHIDFPKKKGKFKKLRTTQSKPKIDITYKVEDPITGKKDKRTFKLKVGSEMHSEITAASLLGTIGYHTDLTKYVRDFKVTLPEGMAIEDFKREWYSYDRFRSFDIDDLVSEIGVDDKGRTYLVFIEALLETKPEELYRIGPWAYGSTGHKGFREVRGLHLFNIWLANNDIKEADNNKLVLKKMPNGELKSFQYQHDVGFTFGRLLKEKPQSFRWKVVTENTKDEIGFNYLAFQPNSGFKHVTYADARWMIRKIGQLSRKQITDAVELGGWPEEIAKLLVEKLISRRNDLVENFELSDELGILEYNRNITTDNGKIENGLITNPNFDGYTQSFGGEFGELIGPAKSQIEKLLVLGARQLPKIVDSTVIGADTLGIDSKLVAEIELDINREIIPNPEPIGIDDNFIVQDTFRIRYALGAGLILRGKGAYFQEFKLLYPVETYEEGMYHNGFIFNALLPRTVRTGNVPEHYVLLTSQGIEGEGELLIGTNTVGASVGISFTKGRMGGAIVSKKPGSYTVMRDHDNYNRLMARIYAELLILRLPVIEKSFSQGTLFRNIYTVDYSGDDEFLRDEKLDALKQFVKTGKFEKIEEFGKNTTLRNEYVTDRLETKLLFYQFRGERRTDTIERIKLKANGEKKETGIYQLEIFKEKELKFFGSGEVKSRQFRFKGEFGADGVIDEPLLDIQLRIEDDSTSSKELKESYIGTINQLALSNSFISFTPELFTRNDQWGVNHINIRIMYNKNSLDKLMSIPEDAYYEIMARLSNQDIEFWKKRGIDRNFDRRSQRLKVRYQKFVKRIKKASRQTSDKKKYKYITEAFNDLVSYKGDAFDIVLLQRVHSLLGRENYFFEGFITIPDSKEMRYPDKTPLYNVMNPEIFLKQRFIEFDYEDVLEAWQLYF